MTEPTYEELVTELNTLRPQYNDLQGALKQARARVKELEAAVTDDSAAVKKLQAELMDIKLNNPVAALLDDVLALSKYSAQELAEHYKFEFSDTGAIEMRDAEGKPVTLEEKGKARPVAFEAEDVRRFLESTGKFDHILKSSGMSGSGAPANYSTGTGNRDAKEPERKTPGAGFGLK